MRQRGFALLTLLPYIIGGIAVASLAGWLWWKADHWCNRACVAATERAVEAEAMHRAAVDRATALALLWSEAIHRVEVRYVEKVVERETEFAGIRERAGQIAYSGAVSLPPAAVGVLRDAERVANAADPGPTGGGEVAAAPVPEAAGVVTTPQEWVTFAVEAAEAYADARDKWQACVSWAGEIRRAE